MLLGTSEDLVVLEKLNVMKREAFMITYNHKHITPPRRHFIKTLVVRNHLVHSQTKKLADLFVYKLIRTKLFNLNPYLEGGISTYHQEQALTNRIIQSSKRHVIIWGVPIASFLLQVRYIHARNVVHI